MPSLHTQKKCALTASRRHASLRTTTADRRAPKVFRPQKSSIAVVRLRAYSPYVRMANERDRRFFVAKKRRKQPHVNRTSRANCTTRAFRDRVHNQTSRKLPPRTTRTYKSLTRPRRGCTRTSKYKNVPQQKQATSNTEKHKLPTTLNTTAKDKAQKAAQQRPTKERRKAYSQQQNSAKRVA